MTAAYMLVFGMVCGRERIAMFIHIIANPQSSDGRLASRQAGGHRARPPTFRAIVPTRSRALCSRYGAPIIIAYHSRYGRCIQLEFSAARHSLLGAPPNLSGRVRDAIIVDLFPGRCISRYFII